MDADEQITDEEMAAYEEAMRLNEELKNKMAMMGLGVASEAEYMEEPMQAVSSRRAGGVSRRPRMPKQQQGMSRRTEAPAGSHLKNRSKANYSFDNRQLTEMGHENQILFGKLNQIAKGKKATTTEHHTSSRRPKAKSSNAINRRKQDDKIQKENLAFLKRLQGTKPTIAKKKHAKDYSKNRQIAANIRQVKPKRRAARPQWED